MSWQHVLQNDLDHGQPLRHRIDALFAHQRNAWPALADGEAALEQLRRKTLESDGESIVVQMNPARRTSTLAKTDSQAVAARPCFLCPENMPTQERGVAFEDLVILPNPFPILPLHCTLAARDHRAQRLAGSIDTFLRLAVEMGPGLAALYNGPRCGASAPDHFHFQAASAADIPILTQLPAAVDSRGIAPHCSFGRNMLIFGGTDPAQIQADIERFIELLQAIEDSAVEPMFNLLAHADGGRLRVVLFPRATHRPACYFAAGPDRLRVSPAILEMCGILVTTEPDDFVRLDANIARAIYAEVSISPAQFGQLARPVTAWFEGD